MIETLAALNKGFQIVLEGIPEHFLGSITESMCSDIEVLYLFMKGIASLQAP